MEQLSKGIQDRNPKPEIGRSARTEKDARCRVGHRCRKITKQKPQRQPRGERPPLRARSCLTWAYAIFALRFFSWFFICRSDASLSTPDKSRNRPFEVELHFSGKRVNQALGSRQAWLSRPWIATRRRRA